MSPVYRTVAGPALTRFRVMAWVTGVGLLILTLGVIIKYAFDAPFLVAFFGPIHGVLYILYLITVVQLGLTSRWPIPRMVLVALGGVVPFLSFYAERDVTARATAR